MACLFKQAAATSPFSLRSKGEVAALVAKAIYRINGTLPLGAMARTHGELCGAWAIGGQFW